MPVRGPGYQKAQTIIDIHTPADPSASNVISPAEAVQAALDAIQAMCPGGYTVGEDCAKLQDLCSQGDPGEPMLVQYRDFTCNVVGCTDYQVKDYYYLVPFVNAQGTTCVIQLNASKDSDVFKPGEWQATGFNGSYQPIPQYPDVTAEKAAQILTDWFVQHPPQDQPAALPTPSLVFQPSRELWYNMFYPGWRFGISGGEWFVSQLGEVFDVITFDCCGS